MARDLLNYYSDQLRKTVGATEPAKAEVTESYASLEDYKTAMKDGTVLEIRFDAASKEGDLMLVSGGLTICARAADMKADLDYYQAFIKDKFILSPLSMKVVEVDEEKKWVFVRSARNNRASTRIRLLNELTKRVRENGSVRIAGSVTSVNDRRAVVDIFGKGVFGILYPADWSESYVRYLSQCCKPGDVLDFDAVEVLDKRKDGRIGYRLSRKSITKNPWDCIPEGIVVPDGVVAVKCIDRPPNKSFWWGISEMVPGVEIMGNYNKNIPDILVSVTYKCKVREFDPAKHLFRVVPFAVGEADADKVEAVRFIRGPRY